MSALSQYYDYLLPELPGCSTAMVDLHLRETVREFCSNTSIWREALNAVDLVAAQPTYSLVTPASSELVRVTKMVVAGTLLWVDAETSESDDPKYSRAEPPFSVSNDLTQITLIADEIPTASVAGGLVVTVALRPTATAATLPDFLLSRHVEAIRLGTLSRLMRMGGKKPWSDRLLSVDYGNQYRALANQVAYQGSVGNSRRPLRVKKWR